MLFRIPGILVLLSLFAWADAAAAIDVVWTETDAGSSLATAEVVVVAPGDELIRIEGSIDPQGDGADVFRIEIIDAANFTAFTTNGDSIDSDLQFDAVLALFDASGLGVYANDDRVVDDGNSELPSGDPLSPDTPGTYYIAIYDDNYAALSALSMDGLIFPEDVFPFTAVRGPTGPGGASPLLSIETLDANPSDMRAYTIELTVPEPGGLAVSVVALATALGIAGVRRSAGARQV